MKGTFVMFTLLGMIGSCSSPSGHHYFRPDDAYNPIEFSPKKEDEATKNNKPVNVVFSEREKNES